MDAIDRLRTFLAAAGYAVEQRPLPVPTRLFATKRGHSAGILLPYTDFIFVHVLDDSEAADGAYLRRMHEQAREYAGSQMRVPKLLRYRVPNVVTIAVSETGFGEDVNVFARESKLDLMGGERRSVYLLDVSGRELISAGPEATPTRYGGEIVTDANPTNRVYGMLTEFARGLFGG